MEMLESLKRYIKMTVPNTVIKFEARARKFETIEIRLDADLYISAMLQQDSFITYKTFSKSSLEKAGFSAQEINLILGDKYRIPPRRRELVMKFEREKIIAEYEEKNNYYRELAGMRPLGDDEDIYAPDFFYEKYNIERVPVHRLPVDYGCLLDKEDLVRGLYATYGRTYLRHLGDRKVDVVTSRLAHNMEMIYCPRTGTDTFYTDFVLMYDECKEYFLSVIYNKDISNMHDRYDDFIAFSIMTMVVQRLITHTHKILVNRDFYDLETIRIFLESYSVPFIRSLPITQLKLLVKSLNQLISNKSTDQVLFDILNILGFNNFDIKKCFLLKQHRIDAGGNPIFPMKEVTDANGNVTIVEDKEKMYDLFFKEVSLREDDIQSALDSTAGTYRYQEFILGDSTWLDDAELRNKVYNTDFNYVETKYMNVNIMVKMYKVIFEASYVMRMILDKKSDTSKIIIELPKLTETPVSLLDTILAFIVLTCNRNGMESTIMKDPSDKLSILGYNFKLDFERIKEDIKKYPKIEDTVCNYIKDTAFKNKKDVDDMYINIHELEAFLVDRMLETTDIDTHTAYKHLYTTLMQSKIDDELFTFSDGTVANTYSEYLERTNPRWFTTIERIEPDMCSEAIDYIANKLMEVLSTLEYFNQVHAIDSYLINGLMQLLRFFKSYTVDIKDMTIVYIFDSKYYNMTRLLSHFENTMVELGINDQTLSMDYNDILRMVYASMTNKECAKVYSDIIRTAKVGLTSGVEPKDLIKDIDGELYNIDRIVSTYVQMLSIVSEISTMTDIDVMDNGDISVDISESEMMKFMHQLDCVNAFIDLYHGISTNHREAVDTIYALLKTSSGVKSYDTVKLTSTLHELEDIHVDMIANLSTIMMNMCTHIKSICEDKPYVYSTIYHKVLKKLDFTTKHIATLIPEEKLLDREVLDVSQLVDMNTVLLGKFADIAKGLGVVSHDDNITTGHRLDTPANISISDTMAQGDRPSIPLITDDIIKDMVGQLTVLTNTSVDMIDSIYHGLGDKRVDNSNSLSVNDINYFKYLACKSQPTVATKGKCIDYNETNSIDHAIQLTSILSTTISNPIELYDCMTSIHTMGLMVGHLYNKGLGNEKIVYRYRSIWANVLRILNKTSDITMTKKDILDITTRSDDFLDLLDGYLMMDKSDIGAWEYILTNTERLVNSLDESVTVADIRAILNYVCKPIRVSTYAPTYDIPEVGKNYVLTKMNIMYGHLNYILKSTSMLRLLEVYNAICEDTSFVLDNIDETVIKVNVFRDMYKLTTSELLKTIVLKDLFIFIEGSPAILNISGELSVENIRQLVTTFKSSITVIDHIYTDKFLSYGNEIGSTKTTCDIISQLEDYLNYLDTEHHTVDSRAISNMVTGCINDIIRNMVGFIDIIIAQSQVDTTLDRSKDINYVISKIWSINTYLDMVETTNVRESIRFIRE